MDDLDTRILEALQNSFPLSERPYDIMARKLRIDRTLLMDRIHHLTTTGVIRRIGLSLDSRSLGRSGTLCAVSAPADRIGRASKSINAFPEVTHCYLRDHTFNIWFTVMTRDASQIDAILNRICANLDLAPSQVMNLPMKRQFKLNARFNPPL